MGKSSGGTFACGLCKVCSEHRLCKPSLAHECPPCIPPMPAGAGIPCSAPGGPQVGPRLLRGSRGGTWERWSRRDSWPAARQPPQGWVPAVRCTWLLPGKPPFSSAPEPQLLSTSQFLPQSNVVYLVAAKKRIILSSELHRHGTGTCSQWGMQQGQQTQGGDRHLSPRKPPHQQNPTAADFGASCVTLEQVKL